MHLPEAAACPLHDTIQHWNGFQNPSQIAEGIQLCFPGRLNQALNHRTDLGAQRSVGKVKVLAAYHKGLDAALGPVVAQFQPSVLQIPQEIGPLFLEVVQGFTQRRLGLGGDRICLCQKRV